MYIGWAYPLRPRLPPHRQSELEECAKNPSHIGFQVHQNCPEWRLMVAPDGLHMGSGIWLPSVLEGSAADAA